MICPNRAEICVHETQNRAEICDQNEQKYGQCPRGKVMTVINVNNVERESKKIKMENEEKKANLLNILKRKARLS